MGHATAGPGSAAARAPGRPPSRALPWEKARKQKVPKAIGRLLLGAPIAPTREEWTAITNGLNEGDPLMDAVVGWMLEASAAQRKRDFERALARGIEHVPDAPEVLKRFFAHVDTDPSWLDRDLMEVGIKASHGSGTAGYYVLRDMALMGGYVRFNAMNPTLAMAGALHQGRRQAAAETSKWVMDVTEPRSMERFGTGFETTIRVRMVHALVRRRLAAHPQWDAGKWGLPINQTDMLATYLAFGPVSLLGARVLGVPVSRRHSKAHMHLWRYVGWLSGVDERWLAETERDGLRKLYHTSLTHALPDHKVRLFGEALRDEPLTRPVPGLEDHPRLLELTRWLSYQRHLSNSALILTPKERRRLGLPLFTVPWYPLLSAPARFATLSYYRLRGGETLASWERRSRRQQRRLVELQFGEGRHEHDIIRPAEGHPAHVA